MTPNRVAIATRAENGVCVVDRAGLRPRQYIAFFRDIAHFVEVAGATERVFADEPEFCQLLFVFFLFSVQYGGEQQFVEKVTLYVYFGGDSLVSVNGVPFQGLDPFRNAVVLTDCAKAGDTYDIDIESYFVWHSNESSLNDVEILPTVVKILLCYPYP